jgi:hypothetical protein
MNLKKLSYLPLFAAVSFCGCTTISIEHNPGKVTIRSESKKGGNQKVVEIEDQFLQKLWEKSEKVVGIYAPMPAVEFRAYDKYNKDIHRYVYGRSCGVIDLSDNFVMVNSTLDINYEELMRNTSYFDSKTMQKFMYGTIAHEFLHCLYSHKVNFIQDPKKRKKYKNENQHCEMIESGNLEALTKFIEGWFGGNKRAREYTLRLTESACSDGR